VARGADRTSAYAQYTVVVEERERIQAALQAAGIPTAVHYPVPIHMQPAYAHLCGPDSCPVARAWPARRHEPADGPLPADEDIRRVCAALLRAARPAPAPAGAASHPL
jgi:UDP-2-acetamido-2-deoxy-ribo-hexuluronate aminotransferase